MSSWKFILSSKFTKYSLRTPYRRTTGDFTSALIQTTIFKSATVNIFGVFLKQTPHFLRKSPFFDGFFYIDDDGEIIRNLMVHHPIPSNLKMWWPSRLFTKIWWPSMIDHHWWTIIVMSGDMYIHPLSNIRNWMFFQLV